MQIINEIKKALYAKYQTSTLCTVDKIPYYLDHVPNSVQYPFIVVYQKASGNSMSMPTTAKPAGWNYVDSLWGVSVYGNDRNDVALHSIASDIEDLYHRQSLTLGASCTHIATISLNVRQSFYDQQNKIWGIHLTLRILAGA